jgi:hypothetical protein
VPNTSTYYLQVAADSACTILVVADSVIADSSKIVALPGRFTTYYWRVRANGTGIPGPFSQVWKFRTALGKVALVGAFGSSTAPSLRWHSVGGATSYRLQVSSDQDFTAPLLADSLLPDTSFTLPEAVSGSAVTSFPVFARWNLLSLPATVSVSSVAALFPDAVSPAFSFEQAYVQNEALETGVGYWIKQREAGVVSVSGALLMADTIPLQGGSWNCIGTIASPVPVATITSIPPGMTISNFFYYRDGYFAAGFLEPGRGYWVKPVQSGSLVFSSSGTLPATDRIRFFDSGEMPPPLPSPDGVKPAKVPDAAELLANYPNPFNPSTYIPVRIPHAVYGTVKIFDVLGREVAVLFDGTLREGSNVFAWQPETSTASSPAGIYFCRLQTAESRSTIKLLYIK